MTYSPARHPIRIQHNEGQDRLSRAGDSIRARAGHSIRARAGARAPLYVPFWCPFGVPAPLSGALRPSGGDLCPFTLNGSKISF